MVEEGTGTEQRKYERLWIEFPVVYRIGRNTLTGSMVNACNEGILVESYLSSKTASKVFRILNKKPVHRLEVKYSLAGKTYLRDAEIRHFHLDFSGKDPYRLTVGFWVPKVD
jgi:hypothetical protein